MQIIESTPFGVRSAIYRLRAQENGPDFLLFPMIHVGAQEFYEEVTERLADCDVILLEGVRSWSTPVITSSYRYMVRKRSLGLVLQHDHMQLQHLNAKLVRADVAGKAFSTKFRALPLWLRMVVYVYAPIYGYGLRWTMTREKLAKRLGTEDRKRREDVSDHEDVEKFIAVLLDWRDEHLIGIIEQHRREPANAAGCIGIVYGAQHMRAVLRHLIGRLGYRVAKAEWVTVFDL